MSHLLLGIDVGTSSCKAAVVGLAGAELAHGQAPTPWQKVPTGAQIDLEDLLGAVLQAARAALAKAPPGAVRAVGVTSMAEGGALLDAHGQPLAPAIAWHDARGGDVAQRIARELPEFTERTGLPPSELCTLAKLGWLLEHHPPARRGRRWLNVAEWVVRRLGGHETAELSLASRTGLLDLSRRRPYAEALDWAGLPPDLLPEPAVATTPAGASDGALLPDTVGAVLAVAGHDHLAAGTGVGVVAPGDVLDSCGTAEALVRVVAPPLGPEDVRRSVEGGVTVGWHVAADRQALLGGIWSGLALREVLDALGADDRRRAELDAAALAAPAGSGPELALELHSLSRRPLELPDAAPELIWRAAIDTATAEAGSVLAHIEAVAGPSRRVLVTGGWARDTALLDAKRALGAVEAPPVVEAGCRGAALIAGVAAGLLPGIDELPEVRVPVTAQEKA